MTTYRVFVSTDLGGDPDDIQSLIHLLHYTDVLRLEGIISSPGPGSTNRVMGIREWIQRTDLELLRAKGHPELMPEADVLAVTRQGATRPGHPGPGQSTEASRLMVERALAPDPDGQNRPLWILVWGSLTDVAQALYDEPAIASHIRINYIGSSNTVADPESRDFVYNFMASHFPRLWWIEDGIMPRYSRETFRGYYLGGDQSPPWGARTFVEMVIRGRGGTHDGLFLQKTGDAMPLARHPRSEEEILKEGDTPTFLYLLSPLAGGVGDVDDATQESWGGRFRRPHPGHFPHYFTDLDAEPAVCQATINRWRVAYLSHWRERWMWYDG